MARLLENGDYNVVVVHWGAGAYTTYGQAVANTRLVGLEIAYLVNTMIVCAPAVMSWVVFHSVFAWNWMILEETRCEGIRLPFYWAQLGSSYSRIRRRKNCESWPYFRLALLTFFKIFSRRPTIEIEFPKVWILPDHILGICLPLSVWIRQTLSLLKPFILMAVPWVKRETYEIPWIVIFFLNKFHLLSLKGFGLSEPVGHLDFYPNGGEGQPGCEPYPANFMASISALAAANTTLTDIVACDHMRVIYLYSDSLSARNNCQSVAYECSDNDSFNKVTYYP